MKDNNSILLSFLMTTILLVISEIVTTTVFPLVGFSSIRFSFFPLLILFLSFYRNSNWIAFLIIFYSYIHSIFSIEVWYLSAFVGLMASIIVAYFSELIHLSNKFVTMFFSFIFQLGMIILKSLVFYLRGDGIDFIGKNFIGNIFEIILLTLLSPLVFDLLRYVWVFKTDSIEEIG